MKTYVLYHGNCPDGFGAALAAWMKFGQDAEYIPVSYGKPMPAMDSFSRVYILDFSYKRQELIELKERMFAVRVLDHHHTAEQELKGLEFAQFDMTRSGAVMAWRHFHPDIHTPLFFSYLEDRDLWRFKLEKSREVSCALRSYPYVFQVWLNLVHEMELLKRRGRRCSG
jgi:oligoribonuclease NrnB/cAMP/cGMP phosphodiesterase (DHH superfamily)